MNRLSIQALDWDSIQWNLKLLSIALLSGSLGFILGLHY